MPSAERPPDEHTERTSRPAKNRAEGGGLDDGACAERPCIHATSSGDGPLTVHAQVRIAAGGHADAVAAAQGNALRDLLAALASAAPHHRTDHIGHDEVNR
jgi:hypothetical protein